MLEKRLLLVAALCLTTWATAAQAEVPQDRWTLVRSEPGISYYLDEFSVSTRGIYLTYWVLVDFDYGPELESAKPYRSARLLKHALCATRAQDTKSFFQYDAPMGQGELRWASTVEDNILRMEPLEPGGVAAKILEMACAIGK